jgi:hypothetical protein
VSATAPLLPTHEPFYGRKAAASPTGLLLTHIKEAVPVLQAAKDGDEPALKQALADWYANAHQIAAFLSRANQANWPLRATTKMMTDHLSEAGDGLIGGELTSLSSAAITRAWRSAWSSSCYTRRGALDRPNDCDRFSPCRDRCGAGGADGIARGSAGPRAAAASRL